MKHNLDRMCVSEQGSIKISVNRGRGWRTTRFKELTGNHSSVESILCTAELKEHIVIFHILILWFNYYVNVFISSCHLRNVAPMCTFMIKIDEVDFHKSTEISSVYPQPPQPHSVSITFHNEKSFYARKSRSDKLQNEWSSRSVGLKMAKRAGMIFSN